MFVQASRSFWVRHWSSSKVEEHTKGHARTEFDGANMFILTVALFDVGNEILVNLWS
jgi:hypothetical protein